VNASRVLTNASGDLSFTKCLILLFVGLHAFGHGLPFLSEGLLMSAAFGKSTFEGWLQRGQWTASSSVSETSTTIIDRRQTPNGLPGFEPAP
jgi:hypothetical protein